MFFTKTSKEEIDLAMLDIKLMTSLHTAGLSDPQDPAEGADGDDHDTFQIFPGHDVLSDRVCKTLYYGRLPCNDRPSLALTKLAVDQFAGVGVEKLGRLDVGRAAEMSRDVCVGPTSLVISLIYLDRLKKHNPDYLSSVSSADLFLVSMMVASKFLHDDGEEDEVFNDEWAKASGCGGGSGMDIKDFNKLELEFLSAMDWRIYVDVDEFESVLRRVEANIAWKAVTGRGWTSYTDLDVLSDQLKLDLLLRQLIRLAAQMTAVCVATYAAGLLTLVGTAALLNQTPFGPTAMGSALKTLSGAKSGRESTPSHGVEPVRVDNGSQEAGVIAANEAELMELNELVAMLENRNETSASEWAEDNRPMPTRPADLVAASLLVATLTSASLPDRNSHSNPEHHLNTDIVDQPDSNKRRKSTSAFPYTSWTQASKVAFGDRMATNDISGYGLPNHRIENNNDLTMAEWLSNYSKSGFDSGYEIPGHFTDTHRDNESCSHPTESVSCLWDFFRYTWPRLFTPVTGGPEMERADRTPPDDDTTCPILSFWSLPRKSQSTEFWAGHTKAWFQNSAYHVKLSMV